MHLKKNNSLSKYGLKNKSFQRLLLGSLMSVFGIHCSQAADEQFNDALRAANAGNIALLDQYQAAMQNDVLGYYPEYWKLNTNLGFQSPSAVACLGLVREEADASGGRIRRIISSGMT